MTLDEWTKTAWTILGVRPLTLRNYQYKYDKHLQIQFGCQDLAKIDRKQIQLWALASTPTVGRACLPVLSSLFRCAVDYELIPANPCHGVKRKPHVVPRRSHVALDELADKVDKRYREPVLFVAMHGLRASEAYAIDEQDIKRAESSGVLTIDKTIYGPTKSGKARTVPYMGNWCKLPKSRQFRECLKPHTFHSLRKTYAYWLKSRGVHISTIQMLLGHSDIQTTMIYIDNKTEEVLQVKELLCN